MRRAVAIVLVALLSSGCYSTTRRTGLSTSPSPPEANESAGAEVVGVVLADGAEVRFVEPAEVGSDGWLHGTIAVASDSPNDFRLVTRPVSYAPGDVAGYLVTGEERSFDLGKTLGLVLGVPAAAIALGFAIYYATCDGDILFCR